MEDKKTKKLNKFSLRYTGITASVLLAVIIFAASVGAWFYTGRKAAGVAEIANPAAIFINAGNQEDIRYLNLGGIDVDMDGTTDDGYTGKKYKDFVFCIRGTNVSTYKLQLAYTTNNQFEYEIFPATETSNEADVPASAKGQVDYLLHDTTGTKYYYIASSQSALAGTFLNKNTSAQRILAKDDDTYYDRTYEMYDKYHENAVPIYWQTTSVIHGNVIGEFTHYYILRVIWTTATAQNNKETDIIYISAKNIASQE